MIDVITPYGRGSLSLHLHCWPRYLDPAMLIMQISPGYENAESARIS